MNLLEKTKRIDLLLWTLGVVAVSLVFAVSLNLSAGFQAGSEFAREVESLKRFAATPAPTFSLTWPTKDGMMAKRERAQQEGQNVRELVELTLYDVQQVRDILPIFEEK